MTIVWDGFPWAALIGGVLIGLASAWLILMTGKIAGISGIVGGLLAPRKAGDVAWRWVFLAGLLLSPALVSLWMPLPAVLATDSLPTLIVAGLLVGIGTRYGSGCTSGHGICGLSRLSPRSLVATGAFMLAGFIVVGLIVLWYRRGL